MNVVQLYEDERDKFEFVNERVNSMNRTSIIILAIMYISGNLISIFGAVKLLTRRNDRQKKINKKTYAKITKVERRSWTDWDSERKMDVIKIHYRLTYEFSVGGISYTSQGYSKWKKRVGRRVKIYYDSEMPQKTQTAEEHNEILRVLLLIAAIAVVMFFLLDMIN